MMMISYSLLIFMSFAQLYSTLDLPSCPQGSFTNGCYQQICNPDWYNWLKGCSVELTQRLPKLVEIEESSRDFYWFTQQKEKFYEIELNYVDMVVKKTRDLAKRVFYQSFMNPQSWTNTTKIEIKEAVQQVSEILSVLQLELRNLSYFDDIRAKILEQDQKNQAVQTNLNQIQEFLRRSINMFNSIKELLQLNPKQVLKEGHLLSISEDVVSKIDVYLTLMDIDLKSMISRFEHSFSKLDRSHEFYQFQLVYHMALWHLNLKSLLALNTDDVKVKKDILNSTKDIYYSYQSLIHGYAAWAYDFRIDQIGEVECQQYNETNCPYKLCSVTSYRWNDTYLNVTIKDDYWIFVEETTFYNLCFIYGEYTEGHDLDKERIQYKNELSKLLSDFYNKYKVAYTLIPQAFIEEKDFQTYQVQTPNQ